MGFLSFIFCLNTYILLTRTNPEVSKPGVAFIKLKHQQSTDKAAKKYCISCGLGIRVLAFLSKNPEEKEEKGHKVEMFCAIAAHSGELCSETHKSNKTNFF